MHRIFLVTATLALLALCLLGGAGVPQSANAARPPVAVRAQFPTPDSGNYPIAPGYLVVPIRWQLTTLPAPGGGTLTLLLDTVNGESYVLQVDRNAPGGYSWARLNR